MFNKQTTNKINFDNTGAGYDFVSNASIVLYFVMGAVALRATCTGTKKPMG